MTCVHAQSCLTLCNPMGSSPPGSSVHGILQAKIMERVAVPSPGNLPDPGIKPTYHASSALAGRFFTTVPPGRSYIGVHWLYNPQYIFKKKQLNRKANKKPN